MTKPTITLAETTDESVLVHAAQKDPQAFKPLYEKYFKSIYVFVLHRVGEKALAADLTSQVFLKALLNIKKYKSKGAPFSSWLYRIALNECYDFFRKSKRNRFVSIDENDVENLYEELTTNTTLEQLHLQLPEILETLSVDELHLLELRYFEHRPFKEVAEILEISETYAKVRVYRLLEKMKKTFIASRGGDAEL